ncbi:melanocyte-stimulating hormone receptor-like [Porites lutea]|uniref:melanocyte-stimulating hormone receptor-like n=1 Tax=Porites lutea TaxID=51062 RepID=UPI003CC5A4E7
MEMKNFTIEELYCSVEFTGEVHGELVFLSVINTFLSIPAFLGNTLILVALHKDTSIHPPSKILYRNLAIPDLCVGMIAEPLQVAYWISVVNKRWDICYHTYLTACFLSVTLCSVSLITLTAISVDRLLALLLGLRYRQVVTLKRTHLIAIGGWIVSIVGASTFFLNLLIVSLYQYVVIAFCSVTAICAYTKIFMSLRHNQIHGQNRVVQGQSSQVNTLNKARYRKAVYSALWVQVTLGICYLPYGIAVALTPQRGMPLSTYLALQFTATLVYLNSSLNPFLYCWRITEVRQAVKETLQQLHFCIN